MSFRGDIVSILYHRYYNNYFFLNDKEPFRYFLIVRGDKKFSTQYQQKFIINQTFYYNVII